jgi:large subunit ribosomal protein L6
MSRIGKIPVTIPSGVTVKAEGRKLSVKGPKGELAMTLRPEVEVSVDASVASVEPNGKGSGRTSRAYHGMTRALLNNMIVGVSKGFSKRLEIIGVGWNASAQGQKVVLNVGYNQPVTVPLPKGVSAETPNPTTVIISGADRQAVGQVAAVIRKKRPPEPYKGKGIRYEGEIVRRKAGKSFGA